MKSKTNRGFQPQRVGEAEVKRISLAPAAPDGYSYRMSFSSSSGWALVCAFGLLTVAAPAAPENRPAPLPIPSGPEILTRLQPGHPRLLARPADFARLRQETATDPQLKEWRAKLVSSGQKILREPASKYEIPDGLRLLSTSRRVVDRMQVLGLLYQLDQNRQWVDRAWVELSAAAAFTNWNPRHFLDTAEMTHGFAIGYDWMYDAWTPQQRQILRRAMVEKGISLAMDIHRKNSGWARVRHNWNQVCNGGIGTGALAIADEEPALCGEFLSAALKSIQLPMAEFYPDGAWNEGPGYWGYATAYNCVLLAALDSALGTDYGLSRIPGFSEAGTFPLHCSAPSGQSYNYADAHAGVMRSPQMFWLARKFNRPSFAWFQQRIASGAPLDLLWYLPNAAEPSVQERPLDKYFRSAEVVTMRGSWADNQTTFVGFKAGDNQANHSNLDLGSFVLEALGVRWGVDLGSDNYNLPGYFGKQRWTYYRLRAEGHNALVINPGLEPDQDPKAAAKVVKFQSQPKQSYAVADLTPAYASQATRVQRGIALANGRQVLVQDEWQLSKASDVWWFFHTAAQVSLDGQTALLMEKGKTMKVRILAPATARFSVMNAQPLPDCPSPEGQNKNSRIRKLVIYLSGVTGERLSVLFTPEGTETAEMPALFRSPLNQW
jgi:hypothetical protein